MSSLPYPAPPQAVPADFTAPSSRYRFRVAVVLLSLMLFLAVYLGLMFGALWLGWYFLASVPQFQGRGALLPLGGAVGAGFFFVFLLKGLFKRQRPDLSRMTEVTHHSEPVLFEFLDRLVEDTRAPRPRKVYVSPDVNAAVFYDVSVLGLFWPVRKNLVVGLGLVNALNLSELKAVLAHELGHFSQRSMKLGSYVYIANKVIADMVFARDGWDRTLSAWGNLDLRISFPAWGLMAVVWVVRHFLGLIYRVINILDAALSREMEFNADRVAVSAAGSDAIVHALKRLVFADACMNQTFHDLSTASDHDLHTRDIFYHQARSADYLRLLNRDPEMGEPPPIPERDPGASRVFAADDDSKPSMWSTHPRDRDREDNAKQIYLPAAIDDRPAWTLFSDPEGLRERVSARLVRDVLGDRVSLSDPAAVQKFIDDERAETTFDPRYHDIYEGRSLKPGNLEAAFAAPPRDRDTIAAELAELWGERVAARMKRHKELTDEIQLLVGVLSGQRAGRSFSFRGDQRPRDEAGTLVEDVAAERTEIYESLAEVDQQVLRVHAEMARGLDDGSADELRKRYGFQLALQELADELGNGRTALEGALEILTGGEELDQEQALSIESGCEQARMVLREARRKAAEIVLPAMSNVEPGTSLADFLFDKGAIIAGPIVSSDRIHTEVISAILASYETAFGRIQRTYFKSVGGILALQQSIADRWTAAGAA